MNSLQKLFLSALALSAASASVQDVSIPPVEDVVSLVGECHVQPSVDTTNTTTAHSIVKLPKMPAAVRAILHQDFHAVDPKGEELLAALKSPGSLDFAHARDNFYTHLQGTFGILHIWNQPEEICRTGLVHTAYSGDLYQFFLWDATKDRTTLRRLIGPDAETLTYLFGTIDRGQLGGFGSAITNGTILQPLSQPYYNVTHRILGTTLVSAQDAAKIILVTIADYLDQMVDTNGWRDHHQVEFAERLYPGDGRPAIALHWFSSACRAVRHHLDVIPSVFQSCTEILTKEDEIVARDAYWKVTLKEFELTEEEQLQLLQQAIQYNPYVGEPHVLQSQIHFRNQRYHQAALEARQAAQKFYALGSAWDKRRSYSHWVGFARMLTLRSNRRLQGKTHLPYHDPEDPTYLSAHGLYLTSLHKVAAEMAAYEED